MFLPVFLWFSCHCIILVVLLICLSLIKNFSVAGLRVMLLVAFTPWKASLVEVSFFSFILGLLSLTEPYHLTGIFVLFIVINVIFSKQVYQCRCKS